MRRIQRIEHRPFGWFIHVRHAHSPAIGLHLWTGQIADSAWLLSVRLARAGAQIRQIVAASAWPGLLGAPCGMGSFGAGPAFADLL